MANLNRVNLIGRATRDAECKTFANGGKVATLGFCVNNRKKDQSGQWVDDPCFLDIKAFNREQGRKLADQVAGFTKGMQYYIEGHLVMEKWVDKESGQNRSKLVIVMDDFQYLEPREGGQDGQRKAPKYGPEGQVQCEDIPF